jgi:pSer/pThr/pTyr-binding forkhead associated (FHA) protein
MTGGTIRIGRTPDNDVVLADLDVSRHHAELRRSADGSVELVDLGSHGGTFVNGQRITARTLAERDVVGIGHTTFRFSEGELRPDTDAKPGTTPAGTGPHDVVAAYWTAAEARDWEAFGALLADVVYRGPQTAVGGLSEEVDDRRLCRRGGAIRLSRGDGRRGRSHRG